MCYLSRLALLLEGLHHNASLLGPLTAQLDV